MSYPPIWRLVALLLAASSFGCSASEAGAPSAKAPQDLPSAPPPAPPPAAPPGHLARAAVDRVLTSYGPSWVLRQVLYEEVVDPKGKFLGWRLTGLPEEWSDVDLQPGDIVREINGKTLQMPEHVWEAWTSVATARVLKIGVEREGAPREVVIPIDGEPSKETLEKLEKARKAPPPPQKGQRGVIRIGGGEQDEAY